MNTIVNGLIFLGLLGSVIVIFFIYLKSFKSMTKEKIERILIPCLETLHKNGPDMYVSVPRGKKYELNILLSRYFAKGTDNEQEFNDILSYIVDNVHVKSGNVNPCYSLLILLINLVIKEQSMAPQTYKNTFLTKSDFYIMRRKSPMALQFITIVKTNKADQEYYAMFLEGVYGPNFTFLISKLFMEIGKQHNLGDNFILYGCYLPTRVIIGFTNRAPINKLDLSEPTNKLVNVQGIEYHLVSVTFYNGNDAKYVTLGGDSFQEEDFQEIRKSQSNLSSYICYVVYSVTVPEDVYEFKEVKNVSEAKEQNEVSRDEIKEDIGDVNSGEIVQTVK